MKTTILTAAVLVFTFLSVNAKTTNVENSTTDFGTYEVAKLAESPVVVNNAEGEYTIHYDELKAPVYVSVVQKGDCKLYLVRTWGYELQYICNGREFGVQLMNPEYAKIDYTTMLSKINHDAFRFQRVITTSNQSELEHVRLIACFLPEVLG